MDASGGTLLPTLVSQHSSSDLRSSGGAAAG
jgi:hypothetical protein